VEVTTRRPFTDLLTRRPPEQWPRWLRALVHRVDSTWFEVRADDLDASLDLLAICRVPRDGEAVTTDDERSDAPASLGAS